MKKGKLFAAAMICAALLTGCGGSGQAELSETETVTGTSATESITETSAPASITETVPETSAAGNTQTKKSHPYMDHIMAFKTSQCLDDEDYGKVKIIRSPEELEEFGDFCERPEEVAEYGSNVDFDKNVVAVNMVFLSSGSYDFEFFNTYVTEGTVNFEYDLIEYDAMTCDIATLYMFAEIPAELISDPYPGETAEKYNDNILSFEIVRSIDDDMYKTSIIRSSDELSEFARAYGVSEDIGDFGDGTNFEKNVIAAQVVLLSCGGDRHKFYGVNAAKGYMLFDYRIIGKDIEMPSVEGALFMLAEIPAELIYPDGYAAKYNDNILSFKTGGVPDWDMYKTSIIRSSEELAQFGQDYGADGEIGDFGKDVDFEKNVIAVQVLCLSSGGYDHIFYGVNEENGKLIFEYLLIEKNGAMTDDEAALFMLAEIPAEAVSQN